MRVALLFTDGVGIGRYDPIHNPLTRGDYMLSQFLDAPGAPLPDGLTLRRLDATFDVPGRPQSASNQTALLTGRPAPRLIGRHVLGFPNDPLRSLLLEASIVRRLVEATRRCTFANAFPTEYLDALGLPHPPAAPTGLALPSRVRLRMRASASTLAFAAGAVPFRTFDDLRAGAALTHDVDGKRARARGLSLPARSVDEAADIFWGLAGDFTLFEHFLADEAGHAQDAAQAVEALETFDDFARAVLRRRPPDAAVLICSDHGNVEDLSTRGHTLNPVPLLTAGIDAPRLEGVRDLADVGNLIVSLVGA